MMKKSAPALTKIETILATRDSRAGGQLGSKYSFQMLRVKRLALAIDMIAAGTSAPMAIAAKAMPTNQDGNILRNSAGTAKLLPKVLNPVAKAGIDFTPDAIAM